MITKINNCTKVSDTRSKHTVTERGKTFELDNISKSKIDVVKVDNCIFPKSDISTLRCDYLMNINDANKLYIIELKGIDTLHAIKQLNSSIALFKPHYKNYIFEARIICSQGYPNIVQTKEYKTLSKHIFPKGNIIISNTKKHSEPI